MTNKDSSDLRLRDCMVCGHTIPNEANFCPKCGSPLTKKDPGVVRSNGGSLAPSDRDHTDSAESVMRRRYEGSSNSDRAKVVEIAFPAEGIVKCPYCAEEIQSTARKCRHCGEWLRPEDVDNDTSSTRLPKQFWIAIAIICALLIGLTTRSFPVAIGIFVLAMFIINLRSYTETR